MISPAYVAMMARYNRWQNTSLIAAASTLDDAARRHDRGAFFGSIHATFNHLIWADQMWLHRFAGTPKPAAPSIAQSVAMHAAWDVVVAERNRVDVAISEWAEAIDPAWLAGELTWFSGAVGREMTQPVAPLVVHLFNHQTHHRGQIHAMLTAAGVRPGDTDLPLMPTPDA